MNVMFRFIRTAVLISTIASSAQAQNFKQAMLNLQAAYDNSERLRVVMDIRVFEDSLAKSLLYSDHADIKRDGRNYLYQFTNTEMLMNGKYMVMVDKSSREIVCSKRDVKGEDKFFGKDPIRMNIDSLMNRFNNTHFIGKTGLFERYRIVQKKGVIRVIDMTIDTQNNRLVNIRYFYRDGQYAAIDFEVFDKQPAFEATAFSEDAYVIHEKGKLRPSTLYSRYTVEEVKN